jgi:hypothetical protein
MLPDPGFPFWLPGQHRLYIQPPSLEPFLFISRNEMKTAIPPNGVTARCVSRRINRSSDNRAVISRGIGLSVAFDSISLLSQILGPNLTPNFGFPDKRSGNSFASFSLGA